MSHAVLKFDENLSGAGLRVGVVQARFNDAITDALRERCVGELERLGVAADDIAVLSVPGALEVPFALQALLDSRELDCLVAIGCVIRGETYHFELVCNESARGVADVSLHGGVPVANAILTVENEAQAQARLDKGRDAARVAVEMAVLAKRLLDEEQEEGEAS
jgi:6,7-dimethyl-8-ribityllumazine synthase